MTEKSIGRPRQDGVERSLLHAALGAYAEAGWAGLSINEILRRAGVGKSAFYIRYASKEDVLKAAFKHAYGSLELPDRGLREVLLAEGRFRAASYSGEHALAVLRLSLELKNGPPVLQEIQRIVIREPVLKMRKHVRRAIESGELPAATSITLLLDAFEGALYMHSAAAPLEYLDRVDATLDQYVEDLVDSTIRAARAGAFISRSSGQ